MTCRYKSLTGEHSENEKEVAFSSVNRQKNKKLLQLKLRKTDACRPMRSALCNNVVDSARNGFKRAAGFANEREIIASIK